MTLNYNKDYTTNNDTPYTNANGPSKCLKQKIQIEVNRVKNPNWPEASQLAIYKRDRGFELRTTEYKFSALTA